MDDSFLILIPARYASTRFPAKPLAPLLGRPMVQWVYDHMLQTGAQVAVVTDSAEIEQTLTPVGVKVVRVDEDVASGSERIHLAYQRYFSEQNFDYIINVQGDEPLLKASSILQIVNFHRAHPHFDVCTALRENHNSQQRDDANNVKAVFDVSSGECFYFSRSAVPYQANPWWLHLGIYCYRPSALKSFCQLPPSSLEQMERLEQLRLLQNKMRIGAVVLKDDQSFGVDTPEDLKRVEHILNNR